MAGSEALTVQGESPAATAGPMAAAAGASAASQRRPPLISIAQLVAVVLGVFAIIWNQQQTTDSLRNELRAEIIRVETELREEFSGEISGLRTELSNEISGLRAEIIRVETELRAEFSDEIGRLRTELSNEISSLRVEVAMNDQRLARIEGFLGIGTPDAAP